MGTARIEMAKKVWARDRSWPILLQWWAGLGRPDTVASLTYSINYKQDGLGGLYILAHELAQPNMPN